MKLKQVSILLLFLVCYIGYSQENQQTNQMNDTLKGILCNAEKYGIVLLDKHNESKEYYTVYLLRFDKTVAFDEDDIKNNRTIVVVGEEIPMKIEKQFSADLQNLIPKENPQLANSIAISDWSKISRVKTFQVISWQDLNSYYGY